MVAGQAVRIPAGEITIKAVSEDNINITRDIDDIFSENVRVSTGNGEAKVVQFDILTSNGVIHAIDTVIQQINTDKCPQCFFLPLFYSLEKRTYEI